MRRLGLVASVLSAAVIGVGCGAANPMNDVTAPSSLSVSSENGTLGAMAGSGKSGGGKGGGGTSSTSTIALVVVNDVKGDGKPNWGDSVTFNVSTTATTEPHVDLTCTQNGVVVYGATTGFYDSYPWPWTKLMTLSSNSWQGGAAECTAKLYHFAGAKTPTLTTLSFTAGA